MLRVILIDDSSTFLASFKELLGRFPAVDVVAVLNDGVQGLRAVADLMPDLVFLDLMMPGMDGMQVARQLQQCQPQTRVVMVSLHDDAFDRSRAAAFGVERFVGKSDLFDELPSILNAGPSVWPVVGARP
ncbi:response regulator transcription factor [Rhodoferax sp.]|uniref:response regulator n=1 Tax=Rhodoferax sp. TaxID=50421 RepID=UPI00275BB11E|nr:response regulator transcription factor [Rhodoferax sp.]